MTYEEKYYETRRKMANAYHRYEKTNSSDDYAEYYACAFEFNILCSEILEELLKENEDVLKRLKEI